MIIESAKIFFKFWIFKCQSFEMNKPKIKVIHWIYVYNKENRCYRYWYTNDKRDKMYNMLKKSSVILSLWSILLYKMYSSILIVLHDSINRYDSFYPLSVQIASYIVKIGPMLWTSNIECVLIDFLSIKWYHNSW